MKIGRHIKSLRSLMERYPLTQLEKMNKEKIEIIKNRILFRGNSAAFFSHSPRNYINEKKWNSKEQLIFLQEADKWMTTLKINRKQLVIHSSYLINLASKDELTRHKSIKELKQEIKFALSLKIHFLVVHAGSNPDRNNGIKKIVESINELNLKNRLTLAIENSPGKGNQLCDRLEDFFNIFSQIKKREKVGICLDTAHVVSSVLKNMSFEEIAQTLQQKISPQVIKVIHLNDLQKGKVKDRHEIIGKGIIGKERIKKFAAFSKLKQAIKILETPFIDEETAIKEISLFQK